MPVEDRPDFGAQFRSPPPGPFVYMGGTAMSCGQHPTLPKRHRWGAWRRYEFKRAPGWDRMCVNCALCSDLRWTEPKP